MSSVVSPVRAQHIRRRQHGGATPSLHLISPIPTCYMSMTWDFQHSHPFAGTKRKQPAPGFPQFPPCSAVALALVSGSYNQKDPAADQKKKQSPTCAAVATFIPALRRASTHAPEPNQHRPTTKLKPFWRRRPGWDRSLLSSESRSHARFPIRLTAQGTAPRNSSAWSCRPAGGSKVPILLHTTNQPAHPAVWGWHDGKLHKARQLDLVIT